MYYDEGSDDVVIDLTAASRAGMYWKVISVHFKFNSTKLKCSI